METTWRVPAVASILFVVAGCGAIVAPTPGHGPFELVDAFVEQTMEQNRTPGMVLAVTNRDELLHLACYGYSDRKLRQPVAADTLFQIGSISKSFTALALLRLWDEGKLDLHAPFVDSVPWFEVQSEYPAIAAHHLLSHTAGIPANRDDVVGSRYMPWSLRQRAAAWAPGDRFHYSNVGYQALHVAVEERAEEDYGSYIHRVILDPLDMHATRPTILLESRSKQAVGYIEPFDDRPAHRSRALVEAPFFEYGIGDGSIQSTGADMASYARMILNRGEGPRGRIVSEEAFELFARPHTEQPGYFGLDGYGYGIGVGTVDGHLVLAHSGGMIGLYGYVATDLTEGVAVVLMVNGPSDMRAIADYAIRVLRAWSSGQDPPSPPGVEDPHTVENAADFAGSFAEPTGRSVVFLADGDRLLVTLDGEAIPLERVGEDTFYTPHPACDRYAFTFARDAEGIVTEVTHGPAWYTNSAYRGPAEFETPGEWSDFVGRYRSYSPWFPYFEIAVVKENLVVFTGEGGESSAGATVLVPKGRDTFRVGTEPTPEALRFLDVVDGQALRAEWSGHQFYRVAW